jgi:hypothetical protein
LVDQGFLGQQIKQTYVELRLLGYSLEASAVKDFIGDLSV